jgi:hypothetical protein
MTSAVVAQTIARSNRNRLIRSIVGFIAVIVFGVVSYRYFYNFFLGPFPIAHDELVAASSPGDLFRYYVTVEGNDVYDTGGTLTHRRNGVVTDKSYYLALDLTDRLLLVEAPAVNTTPKFTGYLEAPASDVRARIIDVFESENDIKGLFLPMQLSTDDFKFPGYLGLIAVVVVLGLSLWWLGTAVQRYGDSGSHPIARALGRFGDANLAISSLDAELMSDHPQVGNLHLTPTWLSHLKSAELNATRFEDIAWVYKMVTTHRTNGVKTGTTYSAQIWDRHGVQIIIPAKEDLVNQILNAVVQRAPWALAGHNVEIEKAWKSNRASVLAAVDERRQQLFSGR